MYKDNPDGTIAAVSTPIGEGGIGIVRLSGPEALKIANEIFVSKNCGKPSQYETYTTHYGRIVNDSRYIDEVLLTVMKAPKSYTKEDIVEINCHGGIQAVRKVLELVVKCGARIAEPGEFTKRAFLNGRIDLAQAEAVLDVVRAKTEASLKVAVSQLEGSVSKVVTEIRERIIDIASQIEASIDFPEEELEIVEEGRLVKKVEDILAELKALIDTSSDGIILREGILATICGKPNTGKSSLMNLLLKRDRVIVTPIPGTTRDAVEEMINLKGIPVRLVDTAGIAKTEDILEGEGIRKSKGYLELADLVLLVLDAATGIDREDEDIIRLIADRKKLVIINKIDLAKKIDKARIGKIFKEDPIVEISVKEKRNIKLLERRILETVWSGDFNQGEGAIVTNARHKTALDRSYENMLSVKRGLKNVVSPELIAIDLKEAILNLGTIVGKSVSEDILDRIFENFCIGK
ncbi:MAG: tRNA uridine-5-carboxymethylaminomethyl(34) synthesis GTPase MnmE [Candidatus Omnitrophica bacterium]|nr:tRNA uridine-5-carboxymethylaminomethyl(34) synthesis GTPase MnmE [Candidatus Omnitrophota bacterium]